MIRMKVSTRIDKRGLKKLQAQLKNTSVNVGYIDSKIHWDNDVPVAQVAANLHYWSPWENTFMLTETRKSQINDAIKQEINTLGVESIESVAGSVGKRLAKQIQVNIREVSTPPNSEGWAEIKGFNDPLIYGSRIGQEPNLISELTYKVGDV